MQCGWGVMGLVGGWLQADISGRCRRLSFSETLWFLVHVVLQARYISVFQSYTLFSRCILGSTGYKVGYPVFQKFQKLVKNQTKNATTTIIGQKSPSHNNSSNWICPFIFLYVFPPSNSVADTAVIVSVSNVVFLPTKMHRFLAMIGRYNTWLWTNCIPLIAW